MIVPTCCQNLVKIGQVVIEISRGQKRYGRTYGRTDVRTYGRTYLHTAQSTGELRALVTLRLL